MKVDEVRDGVFTITATAHEISLLMAGARMSLAVMRSDPHASADAAVGLEKVLDDFDRAMAARRERKL
ncbi:MAG: hypothetical protein ACLGHL_01480 [Actinomycetota bacterium]